MQRFILAASLGFLITSPAVAQMDIQQMLQGLTTGDQRHDQALRDAYQRGYQHGRADERRRLQTEGSYDQSPLPPPPPPPPFKPDR